MSIDAIIYCFNDAPLADCLNCPHFLERSGSRAGCRIKRMGEARKIVEKYQKIEQIIMDDWDKGYQHSETVHRIKEVLEDGNDR